MKRVYVDGSPKSHWIIWYVDGETMFHHDSVENYLEGDRKGKLESHDAEYCAIICALMNVRGDVEIINDDDGIIKVLTNGGKAGTGSHGYVERIRKLEEGRKVNYVHRYRWDNSAGLKQDGFSLQEINLILTDEKTKEELINREKKLIEITKRETSKSRKKDGA